MTVVKGPMMSIDARGKFAGVIVYQKNASGMITRLHRYYNPRPTYLQGVQRSEYGNAIAEWRTLADVTKQVYHDAASGTGKTGVNIFLQEWFHLRFCCRYGFAVYDISVFDMGREYISYPEKLNLGG